MIPCRAISPWARSWLRFWLREMLRRFSASLPTRPRSRPGRSLAPLQVVVRSYGGGSSLAVDYWVNHGLGAAGGSVILASSVAGGVAGDVLVAVASGFRGRRRSVFLSCCISVFRAAIAAAVACTLGSALSSAFLAAKTAHGGACETGCATVLAFWWLFLAAAVTFYIGPGSALAAIARLAGLGPILLFCGLLPALNAPFLWFSVGMTRALLWLGLERKGWWPYFYAFVDAAVAVFVIVLLIGVIVVGVQTLDLMAVRGGGMPILAVAPLLDAVIDGLRRNAFMAEYWWIYT